MHTNTIPTPTTAQNIALPDELDEVRQQDIALPDELDETWAGAQIRIRREKASDKLFKGLKGKHAVAVYRRIASGNKGLTHAQFRVLDAQLSYSTNLTNAFPSRKALLTRVGGSVRTLAALDKILGQLNVKGWEDRVYFLEGDCVDPETISEAGILDVANRSGRFISAVGVVFCIPPNVLAPGAPRWEGPRKFDNRIWGKVRSFGSKKGTTRST